MQFEWYEQFYFGMKTSPMFRTISLEKRVKCPVVIHDRPADSQLFVQEVSVAVQNVYYFRIQVVTIISYALRSVYHFRIQLVTITSYAVRSVYYFRIQSVKTPVTLYGAFIISVSS